MLAQVRCGHSPETALSNAVSLLKKAVSTATAAAHDDQPESAGGPPGPRARPCRSIVTVVPRAAAPSPGLAGTDAASLSCCTIRAVGPAGGTRLGGRRPVVLRMAIFCRYFLLALGIQSSQAFLIPMLPWDANAMRISPKFATFNPVACSRNPLRMYGSISLQISSSEAEMPKLVAVVGATGGVGRLAVAACLNLGLNVRAIVRDKQKAASLLPPSVEVVPADLVNPEYGAGLKNALHGVDAVVIVTGKPMLWLLGILIVVLSSCGRNQCISKRKVG